MSDARAASLKGRIKHGLLHYFENVPDQVCRRKWLVWLLVVAATAFAIAGLGRARFDMTIEGWFAPDDPTIVSMDELRARFGSDDHLYIVYKPKDGNVFSAESLERVRALRKDIVQRMLQADEASPLKRIVKITALDNAPILVVENDALVSRNLVRPQIPTDAAGLQALAQTADGQRALALQYYSKDHRYGGILIETNFGAIPVEQEPAPSTPAGGNAQPMELVFDGPAEQQRVHFKPTDLGEYIDLMNAVKVSLEKPEFAEYFEYYANGNPASTEYNLQVLEEMGLLYSIMLMIMVVVLWFLFRTFSGVLWPLLIVVLSAIWTVGFASWLDVPFTAFLILTVAMVLVIGIGDSVHILSGYEFFRNEGQDHRTALRSAFRSSANACLLTALTSILGMLSVFFTQIIPIQVFGVTTSVGIALAFLFTIYVLPVMLETWWVRRSKTEPRSGRQRLAAWVGRRIPNAALIVQKALGHAFSFVLHRRHAIVVVFAALLSVCIYGMTQVRVDSDVKEMFPKNSKIRENMDVADREMTGSQTLEIYLDLGTEYALHDPRSLRRIDQLQRTLETSYGGYVVRTLSVVDVVKRSYQALNEDRPEMYVVPASVHSAANTFFMFDNSNPGQRRKMVSDNYSEARITVFLRNAGSYEYTRVFEQMQKDIDAALADLKQDFPQAKASVTGMFTLVMQGSDYLSWSSITSFAWAIATISVVLLLIFGSFKAGLISVLANAVPVTMTFGLMGIFNVPLDFTTVLIAPIVLGIAVDDTIHFLSHYRQEYEAHGDIHQALKRTMEEAGQSVTFTAMILATGLSVLAFSASPGNANVGIYGSFAVLVGLACELFLTPALVLVFGLRFPAREKLAAVQPA